MRICVYGAASPLIDEEYKIKTKELGKTLVARGHSLVFGGGGTGLMGAAAEGVHLAGGDILGVMPKFFEDEDIEGIFPHCDKFIKPDTMRERKQIMEDNSDAFIIVPGGIGTFEEFFEILTSKQLCRHSKPIAIYNILGYYNELAAVLDQSVKKGFINKRCWELLFISDDLNQIFDYVEKPVTPICTAKELKNGLNR